MEKYSFSDLDLIMKCIEDIDKFVDRDLRLDYDAWDSVNVHGREHIILELSKAYMVVRVVSYVDSSSMSSVAESLDKLAS